MARKRKAETVEKRETVVVGGVELTFGEISRGVILKYQSDMINAGIDADKVLAGDTDDSSMVRATGEVASKYFGLISYVFGWGIKTDPPPEAIQTLKAMGQHTGIPQLDRANWIYLLLLNGSTTKSNELMAEISANSTDDED